MKNKHHDTAMERVYYILSEYWLSGGRAHEGPPPARPAHQAHLETHQRPRWCQTCRMIRPWEGRLVPTAAPRGRYRPKLAANQLSPRGSTASLVGPSRTPMGAAAAEASAPWLFHSYDVRAVPLGGPPGPYGASLGAATATSPNPVINQQSSRPPVAAPLVLHAPLWTSPP